MRRRQEDKGKEEQRLSSEMLKRKRTRGSGSQAPIPEERSERESPVERLRERSREGRKETGRRAKYGNREGTHERSGVGERGDRGSESGGGKQGSSCEAELRETERKNGGLSSRNRTGSERK